MKHKDIIAAFAILALALTGCMNQEIENRLDWEVESFHGINQDGKEISLQDLEGEVWFAYFMFTNCNTVCPMLTSNMVQVDEMLTEEGIDARIVAFSVDPERDSPETLKEYGQKFISDFSRWSFVTGYEQEMIQSLAETSFKSVAQEMPDSDQFMHGTRFYLIDQDGKVAMTYSGLENIPYREMIQDAKVLSR